MPLAHRQGTSENAPVKTAKEIFGRERALVGMVHLPALPGTPRSTATVDEIVGRAVAEARLLQEAGFDAVALENMHDVPYLRHDVGPEIVAAMTAAAAAVRAAIGLPLGLQVLAGANHEAVAIAHATGCAFVRAEGLLFAAVADEGWMDAEAGPLLRYRRSIGAANVAVLTDIKKKHSSHAVTADLPIEEVARAAEFFGLDGVVVTGEATGRATDLAELERCRGATRIPLVCGSGTTPENVAAVLIHADAAIVGSWIKREGTWANEPDPDRARALVAAARG